MVLPSTGVSRITFVGITVVIVTALISGSTFILSSNNFKISNSSSTTSNSQPSTDTSSTRTTFTSSSQSTNSKSQKSYGTVVTTIRLQNIPEWISFDPVNQLVYVSSDYSPGNVTVINPASNNQIVAVIILGSQGAGIEGGQPIVDTINGLVYVPSGNDIFVLNNTKILTKITKGYAGTTGWGVFDPDNQNIYIATSRMLPSYIAIQVLSTKTDAIIQNITSPQLGLNIGGMIFIAQTNLLYVSNTNRGLSIINASSDLFVRAIPMDGSMGIITNPKLSLIYVEACRDNRTIIVDSLTNSIVGVVNGSAPLDGAYNSQNGLIYVTNAKSDSIQIINGTSNVGSIEIGEFPWGIAYDSVNGELYVSNALSRTVSVIVPSAQLLGKP